MGVILFLSACFLVLTCWILWSRRRYYKLMFEVPGHKGFPLIGSIVQYKNREEMLYNLLTYEKQVGHLFLTWLGPFPFLMVSDPQITKEIFTSQNCVNKSIAYDSVSTWIGFGLVTIQEPQWSAHRKLLNPAFAHKLLLNFVPIFNKEVNALMSSLDNLAHSNEAVNDLREIMMKYTLKISVQTTMAKDKSAVDFNPADELMDSFKMVLESASETLAYSWAPETMRSLIIKDYALCVKSRGFVKKFVEDLIIERTKARPSKSRLDQNILLNRAIDLLQKGKFTRQDVQDEALVNVFAAFETTATTLVNVLMLLAMFPEYQERAFEEVVSVFPDTGAFNVEYTDLQQLPYLDMVLNETLRLIATVPLVAREVKQDIRLSNGLVLPKGLQIVVDIFNMHRREDLWGSDAHSFNPDNFLPSNLHGKHPYCFVPFTKGIRSCIGSRYAKLSIKLALAKLIRNYHFTTDFKFENLSFIENITVKLKETPSFRIYKREL